MSFSTRQAAVLLTVVSFLHSFLQVTQRLAPCPEVPQQVSMFLVCDWWTLWANVDGPGRPIIIPCDWMKQNKLLFETELRFYELL